MIPLIQTVVHPISQRECPSILCGAIAPLFTPERLDGKIDFDGLEALTDFLCAKSAVSSIMIRTGEGRMWSYSLGEVRDAISCVIRVAKGRKPVIAGTAGIWDGGPDNVPRPAVYFRRAVDLSHWALACGAAAVLQPVPVFLQPGYDYGPQELVMRFFEDIARTVNGPVIIYHQENVPRAYALSPSAIARLSRLQQLVGVIYYTNDSSVLAEIVRQCDPRFTVMSGCDSVALPAFMAGASSSSGSLATLVPEVLGAAWQSLHEPDLPFAWRAQTALLKVREVLHPWPAPDIGCAFLANRGIHMAGRSRAAAAQPARRDVERVTRELSLLTAAYM